MPKHSKRALSSDMIIIVAFVLIFAFMFAIMIMNTEEVATQGAEKLPKYKIYSKCINSLSVGWDYAKECATGVVRGA